ncbi:MAG: MBL fold metallo-hydrolase [Sedimentisphaerales bacterium]|nr:MBL fold metallo-hydrolase [Sedimentisphaerales bacterium]
MTQKVKITTLVEDTAQGNGLTSEHGISFWIEYGSRKLLFDTGQSSIIIRNAQILGIDLSQTEAVVISHGHYDHTGGLEAVLSIAKKAKIYIHPNALDRKYSYHGGSSRFVGIAGGVKSIIESHVQTNAVVWTKEPTEIFDGLFVTGQVPKTNDFEIDEDEFFLDEYAQKSDELPDDQSLFFRAKGGLVVVLGCAHAGVINILNYITKISGISEVYAVMGGMHLVGASKEKMAKVMDNLEKFGLQKIGPGHCTGSEAALELRKVYPRRCFMCSVGTEFECEVP